MKKIFFFFFILNTFSTFGQNYKYSYEIGNYIDVNKDDCNAVEVLSLNPAPCSIERRGYEVDIYLIRIGIYKRRVVSASNIWMQPMGDYYFYYLNINFKSEQEAVQYLKELRKGETNNQYRLFCDALVEKHPTGAKMFINY